MKNKTALIFLIILFFTSNVLFAQSENNEQRIIGTWTVVFSDEYILVNTVWTFNSNGSLNVRASGENVSFQYLVAGSKIFVEDLGVLEINISADGRALILVDRDFKGMALRKN